MAGPKHHVMKGDRVRVIRGNYRDVEGTVIEVLKDSDRVRVEGVNPRKKHTRPSQEDPDGGIITFDAPVHISNVMLVDPASDTASRIRIQVEDDGTKERIAVKTGNPIPRTR